MTIRLPPPFPRGQREEMGGAPTAQDTWSGPLSDALSPKRSQNNRDYSWGRRLEGHPIVFYNVCMQRRGDLNQERERERETPTTKPNHKEQTTKKQVRGGGLGENAVPDVRVDDVERGQDGDFGKHRMTWRQETSHYSSAA